MTTFRVAVVDGEAVCQWREPLVSLEDAQAAVPLAEAEHPDCAVRVESLQPDEVDGEGRVVTHVWTEV